MTSKERLLAALKLEEPDHVPVVPKLPDYILNLNTKDSTGCNLCNYLRDTDTIEKWGPLHPSEFGSFLSNSEELRREVRTHKKGISTFYETIIVTPKGQLKSLDRIDDNIHTIWHIEPFLKNVQDVGKFFSIPYTPIKSNLSGFSETQGRLGDNGIVVATMPDPIGFIGDLFSFEQFLVLAFTEKKLMVEMLDMISERVYDLLRYYLKTGIGPLYRISGAEYVTPPYLPPHLFDEYVVKYDRKMVDLIHEFGCYAWIHCHGRVNEILEKIVSIGADAIEPVEGPPDGDITIFEAKQRVGKKICLMGNIPFRAFEYNTIQEIDILCREAIKSAGKKGGFILTSTATPIKTLSEKMQKNYIQFIISGRKYGAYPLNF